MNTSLKEILYKYFLKNDVEDNLKQYNFLYIPYLDWKNTHYINCSCCKLLVKKEFLYGHTLL